MWAVEYTKCRTPATCQKPSQEDGRSGGYRRRIQLLNGAPSCGCAALRRASLCSDGIQGCHSRARRATHVASLSPPISYPYLLLGFFRRR